MIIGCGGLSGYLIENMTRLSVSTITAVDADSFEPSNLNRQLLSTMPTLGRGKAQVAQERAKAVNPLVALRSVQALFDADSAP